MRFLALPMVYCWDSEEVIGRYIRICVKQTRTALEVAWS